MYKIKKPINKFLFKLSVICLAGCIGLFAGIAKSSEIHFYKAEQLKEHLTK